MTEKISVHLVNYEETFNNGILSKFAHRMHDELEEVKGVTVTMSSRPNSKADINHHINYASYHQTNTINTLMVTHVDTPSKIANLKRGMDTAEFGICMSEHTQNSLIEMGFNKNKLTTILPAHDNIPRRYQIVAILTNVYPDGCKREDMFIDLAKTLDNKKWAFRIMGSGWHDLLVPLVAEGLQVDYFAEFDAENHQRILESSDYSLYFGVDEGSMGLLDSKNAGLKLIAPPIGFNIDIGVDYPFHTQEELNTVFKKLSFNPVESWTWEKYVKDHLKLWKKLAKSK